MCGGSGAESKGGRHKGTFDYQPWSCEKKKRISIINVPS